MSADDGKFDGLFFVSFIHSVLRYSTEPAVRIPVLNEI